MKRFLVLLIFVFHVISLQAADITVITSALKTGNVAAIQKNLSQSVDMALTGDQKICDAKEASKMLNVFFTANKPTSFTLLHHAEKKDSGFFVAKMKAGGNSYRINVTYKMADNKVFIQSIRIE